jgi:hypothetical protein
MSYRKIIAALLMTAAATSDAAAQFKAVPDSSFGNGYFECGIIQSKPADRDPDPIYKINVSLSFTDENKLSEMTVTHTAVSGKSYQRSDQYANSSLVKTPDKLEIYWRGYWRKNPSVLMVGHFWYEMSSRRWNYQEIQSKNGHLQMTMTAICNSMEGE